MEDTGRDLRLSGDAGCAIPDCNRALAIKPDYADALSTRGQAKSKMQDHKAALQDCKEAQRLNPPTLELKKSDWTHLLSYTTVNAAEAEKSLEIAMEGVRGNPDESAQKLRKAIDKAETGGVSPDKVEAAKEQLSIWEQVAAASNRLKSTDTTARKEACKLLGPLGDVMAIPGLDKLLQGEKDRFVRHRAMEALAMIGNAVALPILEKAIKRSEKLEDKAGVGIGQCAKHEINGDWKAIEKLMAGKPGSWVKNACSEALARMKAREPPSAGVE